MGIDYDDTSLREMDRVYRMPEVTKQRMKMTDAAEIPSVSLVIL